MNESIRLGRVAGVAVGINWSLLAIFGLVAVSLSAGRLPDAHPNQATGWYVAIGVSTAVLFFASVLAHELSHALVAIRNGIEVDGIVLWLFGGVARMRRDAGSPGAAFRIAVVGPLVSLLLGVVFLAVSAMFDRSGASGLIAEGARWLGVINIVLAVFNLFPGAPLDGGRVLRAILWRVTGDEHRSWVLAARAGRVVGYVVIAFGVLQFAAFGVGGLWLVLIGWFLVAAARAEEAQATMRGTLGDMPVSQVMSPDPVTAPAGISVQAFLDDYVFRHRFSTFPVVDDAGRVLGLATVNRVKDVPADQRSRLAVEEVATPVDQVATAAPGEPATEAIGRLGNEDARLLVMDGGRVVGIVSPLDVVHVMELASLRSGGRVPIG